MIRIFDVILSSLAILLLSPVIILIMIVLKFTGEGDIFYIQQRIGRGGKNIGIFKFATMLRNSPNLGTGFITTKEDPRVLPVGRILRKTKLNEVPQIFNILSGSMSFVGPRPQVKEHFEVFPKHVKKALKKLTPGLTGIGSIIFRDEESILEKNNHLSYTECYNNIIAPYKGELELWYLENKSIFLYFKLILITAWIVLFPKSKIYAFVLKNLPPPPKELNL